ncbi:MAG: 4Fe-4S dicluster domain-containing protein [Lentisphaeria bacterium]|jgi:MauM/NapG family ferredoxin protein|nr:4Fe-4S dicluster domain-containing protein [Lentisphaeria bacterium]
MESTKRRSFIVALIVGAIIPLFLPLLNLVPSSHRLKRFLRPPGAKRAARFRDLCIGCGQCATACPNNCISLLGLEHGIENLATPAITPRAQACILCMACTQVCPTGALDRLEPTDEGIRAVDMGKAFVTEDLCYSFSGRTCGVCYRACPLPGKAMSLGLFEQPFVNPDYCVGCGLCEQACVQMPQAIRVVSADELAQRKMDSSTENSSPLPTSGPPA